MKQWINKSTISDYDSLDIRFDGTSWYSGSSPMVLVVDNVRKLSRDTISFSISESICNDSLAKKKKEEHFDRRYVCYRRSRRMPYNTSPPEISAVYIPKRKYAMIISGQLKKIILPTYI